MILVKVKFAHSLIAHLLIFSQKKSNSLRKPMSEFPALPFTLKNKCKKVWNLCFKTIFFTLEKEHFWFLKKNPQTNFFLHVSALIQL